MQVQEWWKEYVIYCRIRDINPLKGSSFMEYYKYEEKRKTKKRGKK